MRMFSSVVSQLKIYISILHGPTLVSLALCNGVMESVGAEVQVPNFKKSTQL